MKFMFAHRTAIIIVVLGIGLGLWNATEGAAAAPDLTVTALSAPASAARNTTISVIHTTKNVGNLIAPSSTSYFYLCTNNVACGSRINQQAVGSLAVNASKTYTNTSFSIPAGQPLGTNYIVDVCGIGITEPNKANNTNSTPIVITE